MLCVYKGLEALSWGKYQGNGQCSNDDAHHQSCGHHRRYRWRVLALAEGDPWRGRTALSLVVIFVALYFTVQLQKRGGVDEGRLMDAPSAYSGARVSD